MKKTIIVLILILLPILTGVGLKPVVKNSSELETIELPIPVTSLLTAKQQLIAEFMQYQDVYCNAGINPILGIAQAISEQGWELDTNTYRVYNITWSEKSVYSHDYECVWDNGTWAKYRVYKSLELAIEDYVSMLSLESRYEAVLSSYDKGFEAQAYAMAHSGYAEMDSDEYYNLLLAVGQSITRRL